MPIYSARPGRPNMPLSTSPRQNIESQVKTALDDELRRSAAYSRAHAMHGAMWAANDAQRVALGTVPLNCKT